MKYVKQIDGLRFIAVMFVLIEHFASIIGRYISAGFYGVDLFFVISGFLITGILIKSGEPFSSAYFKFIGRRSLRIFPLYYLTILILLLLNNTVVKEHLLSVLSYTYNYVWVSKTFQIPGNMGHFWSLCVEEQFYLFWPFLVLSLRQNLKVLKYFILVVIVMCSIQYYFNLIPELAAYKNFSIFPRANSLAIGGLGAILLRENKIPLKMLETKWIEYACLIILVLTLISSYNLKFSILPVISLFLILKTTHKGFLFTPLNRFLNNKNVIYFGSISYGIYVFHVPLEFYFGKYVFDPLIWNRINFRALGPMKKIQWHSWIFKLSLYSVVSIILAHLSFKYFENPFLLLKEKYFKY